MNKIAFLKGLFEVLESLINTIIGATTSDEPAEATAESKFAALAVSGLVDCVPEFSAAPELQNGSVTYTITMKADAENPDVLALSAGLTDEDKAIICGIATATVVKTTASGVATFTDTFAINEKWADFAGATVSVEALSGEVGLATLSVAASAEDGNGEG